jgi:hypothetical protein
VDIIILIKRPPLHDDQSIVDVCKRGEEGCEALIIRRNSKQGKKSSTQIATEAINKVGQWRGGGKNN